jgi:hypothetical protein
MQAAVTSRTIHRILAGRPITTVRKDHREFPPICLQPFPGITEIINGTRRMPEDGLPSCSQLFWGNQGY